MWTPIAEDAARPTAGPPSTKQPKPPGTIDVEITSVRGGRVLGTAYLYGDNGARTRLFGKLAATEAAARRLVNEELAERQARRDRRQTG